MRLFFILHTACAFSTEPSPTPSWPFSRLFHLILRKHHIWRIEFLSSSIALMNDFLTHSLHRNQKCNSPLTPLLPSPPFCLMEAAYSSTSYYPTSSALSYSHCRCFQSGASGKMVPQPGNLLETQMSWPHARPTEMETLGAEPATGTPQGTLKHDRVWEPLLPSITLLPLFKYHPHSKVMPLCHTILCLSWTVPFTIFTVTYPYSGVTSQVPSHLTLGTSVFRGQSTQVPYPKLLRRYLLNNLNPHHGSTMTHADLCHHLQLFHLWNHQVHLGQ